MPDTYRIVQLFEIFRLATLLARREAKTRIRQYDWLKLVSEKIRREQVETVPTFFFVRASKSARWKIGVEGPFRGNTDLKLQVRQRDDDCRWYVSLNLSENTSAHSL